jgi:hypothetical protein
MVILRIAMLVVATIAIWAPARASTAFLDQATEFVRDEAEALSGTLDTSTDAFRYYASLSAMTLVQTRLSSIRYAAMMTKPGFKPPVTPEDALAQGVGLCGDHTAAFEAIFDRLGIPSRRVQVFWKPSTGDRYGHIFPEVFWGGRWRMIDVTNGFLPKGTTAFNVLSLAEVRAGMAYTPLLNQTSPWFQNSSQSLDVLEYLTVSDIDIITDGAGVTHPYIVNATAAEIAFGLGSLINYIGSVEVRKGVVSKHAYEIQVPAGFRYLEIDPGGKECVGGMLTLNNAALALPSGPLVVEVTPGPLRIAVRTTAHSCYVIINGIALRSVRAG